MTAKLKDKLNPRSCEPKSVTVRAKKVQEEYEFQRRKFLRAKATENAVQELIQDHDLKAAGEPVPSEEERVIQLVNISCQCN